MCAAAHAKAGTCKYESVPYEEAVGSIHGTSMRGWIEEAPRGNDTAEMDAEIEQLKGGIDAGEDQRERDA